MTSQDDEQRTLIDEPVTVRNMAQLRSRVRQLAVRAGLSPQRAEAFVIAVNEAVTNAIEHARGCGEFTLVQDDRRLLIAEVRDAGPGMPCSITLTLPPTHAPRGRGMWLAGQLADHVEVHSDQHGTTVHITMDMQTPEPEDRGD